VFNKSCLEILLTYGVVLVRERRVNDWVLVLACRLNRSLWVEHDANWCRRTNNSSRRPTPTSSTCATRPTSASRTVAPDRWARTAVSVTGCRAVSTAASSCVAGAASTCAGGGWSSDVTASFTGVATLSVRNVAELSRNMSVDDLL